MTVQIENLSVLVVGSGSIGRRHMRNLRALGVRVLTACDLDRSRLSKMVNELGIQAFADFNEALDSAKPDIVFICTPPVSHVPQALQAARAGAHLFIEKPLSHTLDGVGELIAEVEARHRVTQVGYNLRFDAGLRKAKQLVEAGTVGRVLWARAEFGQYLPDWRPWQDYRNSYTARRELGGGIVLDGSHELDYVIWIMGAPTDVACMMGKVSMNTTMAQPRTTTVTTSTDCATFPSLRTSFRFFSVPRSVLPSGPSSGQRNAMSHGSRDHEFEMQHHAFEHFVERIAAV